MVARKHFAMVQHNGHLCTKSGFSLQRMAEIWVLGLADQPTFAAIKQLELTSVVLHKVLAYCDFH